MSELETHCQELITKGEQQLTNHIPELLNSWETFQQELDTLSDWVEMSCSELASLRLFPQFLDQFDALHTRHQVGLTKVDCA